MCILCVHSLLKGVSHCDFSVLSMSVMGFQKKLDVGVVSSIHFFIFEIVLTLQSPPPHVVSHS